MLEIRVSGIEGEKGARGENGDLSRGHSMTVIQAGESGSPLLKALETLGRASWTAHCDY